MTSLTITLSEDQRSKLEQIKEQIYKKTGLKVSLSKTVGKLIEDSK